MTNVELFTAVLGLGTFIFTAAAVAAAFLSVQAAKTSAEAARISTEHMKQQNDISLVEKRLEKRDALTKYIIVLSTEGWDFNEGEYLVFQYGITDSMLFFPKDINILLAEIRIKTDNFLGQRDEIGVADSEEEKSAIIKRIKPMKNDLRDHCIKTVGAINKYLRSGLQS